MAPTQRVQVAKEKREEEEQNEKSLPGPQRDEEPSWNARQNVLNSVHTVRGTNKNDPNLKDQQQLQ